MKVLKKQGLTLFLIAALVVTLTLGIVFALPARNTANADEGVSEDPAEEVIDYGVAVPVSNEKELKDAVKAAADNPTLIKLTQNIEMSSITCGGEGTKYYELRIERGQNIQLDLAGNTLSVILNPSSNYVIVNSGKLSIIDSSGNYSGKVVSNGYIVKQTSGDDWSAENPGYIWRPASVIYNYGDLTINANIGLEMPESKGEPGEDGYYNGTHSEHKSMIISSLFVPDADDPDQTISNSSVTVEGGTFSGQYMYVFQMEDADLTIKDGTFTTLASTGNMKETFLFSTAPYAPRPSYQPQWWEDDDWVCHLYPGQEEKIEAALAEHAALVDKLTSYHHSTIEIRDGDFTAYTGDSSCFEIETKVKRYTSFLCDEYSAGWETEVVGEATFSFALTGGRWGRDLSDYVPDGYWMELFQETTQAGDILSKYYQVGRIDEDRAGALLEVNDAKHYYATFASALLAAKTMQAETRTITLLSDNQIGQIGLTNLKGELRLDLNGHKLTVEPTNTYHITGGNGAAFKNSFIICDGSDRQDGELILSVKSGNAITGGSFIKVSQYTKFILESGTIRQTGYVPATYYDTGTALYKRNCNLLSLFKFEKGIMITDSNVNNYADCVQIKGGNILSDLEFGTEDNVVGRRSGELFAWWDGKNNQYPDYECGLSDGAVSAANKTKIFVVDLGDYLADGTKACRFSWDFNDIVSANGLASSPDGNDGYIVTLVSDGEYFIVGSEKATTLQDALQKAQANDTISVLQDATVSGDVEIGNGITLNLNRVMNFKVTFEGKLTLEGGASIKNGTIMCNEITVDGDVTLEEVTVTGKDGAASLVTVQNGTVTIPSGKYNCNFTIIGGTLDITGGFFRGDRIEGLEQYFGKFLGGYITAGDDYQSNELYEVKFAPNLKAQAWYKKYKDSADKTFLIETPEEWGYFALYVNSGADNFYNKTVKINKDLDFASGTASGVALAVETKEPNFMPAGNIVNSFLGTLDGCNHVISGIIAREKYVGLIGYAAYNPSESALKVNNLTVTNSIFTVGNGYLDAFNGGDPKAFLAGGAIVGFSHFGIEQSNIKLDKVTVDYDIDTIGVHKTYSGAVIGHTFGGVSVKNFEMTGSSVMGNWKTGGVVGFNEGGSLTLKEAHISDVKIEGNNSFGVVAGHTQCSKVTLENCTVETPDQSLVGTASVRDGTQEITVTGPKTDIHVHSLGTADTNDNQSVKIELSSDGEGNSSQVQFSEKELPSNLTVTRDGKNIVQNGKPVEGSDLKQDPENGSFIFEADPQMVDLYTGSAEASSHTGSYESFAAALAAAQPGDRIYLTNHIAEEVTIGSDKNVTINLGGYTLTGNIAVEGTLTLEHGTVIGSITIVNNGSLTLVWAGTAEENKADLTIDNSTASSAAIVGEYTVKGSACARRTFAEDVVTKIELYEKHDAVYTANGNVITVTCEHCGLSGMITVEAEDFIYDGNDHEAEVTGVPEWLAEGVEITYYQKGADGEYTELLAGLPNAKGFYKASITVGGETASVEFSVIMEVIVSEINLTDYAGEITYGDNKLTIKNFKLKDIYGNDVEFADGEDLTLTVTLKASKVGQTVAIITSLSFGGTTAGNYTLALAGQPAFLEVEVVPATLYASVDENGNWSFTGFVNGDDESVLSGTPELTRDGKVIGITSENYNIVYVGELDSAVKTDLTALWVVLAVVGAAAVVGTGLYFGTRRKKQ